MSTAAVVLLGALLIGHQLGDFTPLSNRRIQQAKANGGPMGPIVLHAAVHALLVAAAVLLVAPPAPEVLALVVGLELVTHFVIDATRARLNLRAPILSDLEANPFWWALGVDQLLHGLVLVAIAWLVLS